MNLDLLEAIHRANLQAENRGVVTARDIQRILPELFLDNVDFSSVCLDHLTESKSHHVVSSAKRER